jgi:hypothetical protein
MTPVLDGPTLDLEFEGEVIQWRGPSPFHFVVMPDHASADVRGVANAVSYGWGCIPVRVRIEDARFTTALIPKDGRYLVPLKDVVRKGLGVSDGDVVAVVLTVGS